MRAFIAIVATTIAGLWAIGACSNAGAVDLHSKVSQTVSILGTCRFAWKCGPEGCAPQRVCRYLCRGYFCYSLYGAYGPYGGPSYWGAYTQVGWEFH